ncbi:MAG TPA: DNA repair protein RadC [Stellaceae bacterium]|nr:DNA repair protein RadC [Stellaceae bacterium]
MAARRRSEASDPPDASPHYLGHRQRLRERLIGGGTEPLADYELLEFLLYAGIKRGDTKELAKNLIKRFGSFAGVLAADHAALTGVPGMGDASAAALLAVREAAARMLRAEIADQPVISSWQALIDYCTAKIGFAAAEEFHLLFLDRKNALIADERQQQGTVDHTPVYPREVVKRALELNASAIIMIHNHPSGDVTPSRADIEMTRQVREAAKAVGIALHDHLVIGRGKHASLKSLGLM